jgi:hypothetical protein
MPRRLFRLAAALLLVCAPVVAVQTAPPAQAADGVVGPLRTSGNQVVDGNGTRSGSRAWRPSG